MTAEGINQLFEPEAQEKLRRDQEEAMYETYESFRDFFKERPEIKNRIERARARRASSRGGVNDSNWHDGAST